MGARDRDISRSKRWPFTVARLELHARRYHAAGDLGRRSDAADKLFLCEMITNPLMRVARLREIIEFAQHHGPASVIDNTFATPVNFGPLSIGFDRHSATKYLNGYSDLVAGCVVGAGGWIERVRKTLNHFGGSLDPGDGADLPSVRPN